MGRSGVSLKVACFRLISAATMGIDEDWQTGWVYLVIEKESLLQSLWLWKSGQERSGVHFSAAQKVNS